VNVLFLEESCHLFQCINVTAGITFNDSILHFSCGVMMICQCNSVLLQDFFLKELSLCKSGEANDLKRAEERNAPTYDETST
jgi:hypothetical protein